MDNGFTAGYLAEMLDRIEVAVIIVEKKNGLILYVNRRVGGDMSLKEEAMIGAHYRQIFSAGFIPIYELLVQACEDGMGHIVPYYWGEKEIWEQVSAREIPLDEGSVGILLSITNIDGLMAQKIRFEQLALYDATLHLPNGKKLEADLAGLYDPEEATLIYFDIEYFDQFCELYGWDVGDGVLLSIRDWLLKHKLEGAQLYRIGNGFALLRRNVSLEKTIEKAEQILDRFRSSWTFAIEGALLERYLTIRLGIVFGKRMKSDMRSMLMRTLHAPRNADGYAIYDDELDANVFEELELRNALINCIRKGMEGFEVVYQPIVDASSARWAGLEALCRWTSPGGRRVPPSIFIPAAEKLGLIHEIDAWVCCSAVRHCVDLGLDREDFFLDINFSPWQMITDEVADSLAGLLKETGFPPEKLVIEITENAKVDYDKETLKKFDRVREQGVFLSLDDFGTGYSSLENLIMLSVFAIKIDKMFLNNIETEPYRQYLLRTLVDIAKHLGMKVVLEGVETARQRELLRDYDIDYYQGYLFAKPMRADALEDSFKQRCR